MLTAFRTVVDYRYYRLVNRTAVLMPSDTESMYKLKKQVDGLYPTLKVFDGFQPIKLFDFLTTMKEALNGFGKSEAIGVRLLAFYLSEDAKSVYEAQVNPGTASRTAMLNATWPYVINAMIRRFLTEEVLQEAFDEVDRAKQLDTEDEMQFAQRMLENSRKCCHVFTPSELVNNTSEVCVVQYANSCTTNFGAWPGSIVPRLTWFDA